MLQTLVPILIELFGEFRPWKWKFYISCRWGLPGTIVCFHICSFPCLFTCCASLLHLLELLQLTLWDLRMKENGGCLQRISGSLGDIFYAVCSSSTGNVAVGGADRTVTIYDPRRLVITIGLFGTMYGDRGFVYNSLGFSFLMREVSFVPYDLFF